MMAAASFELYRVRPGPAELDYLSTLLSPPLSKSSDIVLHRIGATRGGLVFTDDDFLEIFGCCDVD